jgi:hypothetical protein
LGLGLGLECARCQFCWLTCPLVPGFRFRFLIFHIISLKFHIRVWTTHLSKEPKGLALEAHDQLSHPCAKTPRPNSPTPHRARARAHARAHTRTQECTPRLWVLLGRSPHRPWGAWQATLTRKAHSCSCPSQQPARSRHSFSPTDGGRQQSPVGGFEPASLGAWPQTQTVRSARLRSQRRAVLP